MHIAIIGAGISGLMSALELVEQGCTISIFDQQQGTSSLLGWWRYSLSDVPVALCACSEPTRSIWQSLLSSMELKALPCYRD